MALAERLPEPFGRQADAVVDDVEPHRAVLDPHAHLHLQRARVLGRVAQQLARQREHELVAACLRLALDHDRAR